MNGHPDERASLHGLTPEEALRALLAVDPDDEVDHKGGDAFKPSEGRDEAAKKST